MPPKRRPALTLVLLAADAGGGLLSADGGAPLLTTVRSPTFNAYVGRIFAGRPAAAPWRGRATPPPPPLCVLEAGHHAALGRPAAHLGAECVPVSLEGGAASPGALRSRLAAQPSRRAYALAGRELCQALLTSGLFQVQDIHVTLLLPPAEEGRAAEPPPADGWPWLTQLRARRAGYALATVIREQAAGRRPGVAPGRLQHERWVPAAEACTILPAVFTVDGRHYPRLYTRQTCDADLWEAIGGAPLEDVPAALAAAIGEPQEASGGAPTAASWKRLLTRAGRREAEKASEGRLLLYPACTLVDGDEVLLCSPGLSKALPRAFPLPGGDRDHYIQYFLGNLRNEDGVLVRTPARWEGETLYLATKGGVRPLVLLEGGRRLPLDGCPAGRDYVWCLSTSSHAFMADPV